MSAAAGAEQAFRAYSADVRAYLDRIYDESLREYAFHGSTADDVAEWQRRARPALRRLIGLEAMDAALGRHRPSVELGEEEDLGAYTRRHGRLLVEPNVWIPFWLLAPRGRGPFPLALTPHGHDSRGHDTSAGIAADEAHAAIIREEDRDVAVQAVRRGFLAIAPATRGISADGVPDIHGWHGNRDCHSQFVHCLLAGRTAIAERVWDMGRFLDWALAELPVDRRFVLMLGNSGGGMITTYAAACDERIGTTIPSCSFSLYVRPDGKVSHCTCNTVPGILRFGEFYDVAGLISPRHLLLVTGRHDPLHVPAHVDMAVARLRRIYEAAGAGERFEHRYGEAGHRFYADLMWPFVDRAMAELKG